MPHSTPYRRSHRLIRATAGALLLLPALGLSSCSPAPTPAADSTPSAESSTSPTGTEQPQQDSAQNDTDTPTTTDSTPTPTATADPNDPRNWPQCSGLTGQQALEKWVDQVPRHQPDWPWSTEWAGVGGYDECAALSFIPISIEGATASSPNHIMLFHKGRYLGTATKEAFAFSPTIRRETDSLISVVFHWRKPGESTAGHTGESHAQFAWDHAENRVIMTGEAHPTD